MILVPVMQSTYGGGGGGVAKPMYITESYISQAVNIIIAVEHHCHEKQNLAKWA